MGVCRTWDNDSRNVQVISDSIEALRLISEGENIAHEHHELTRNNHSLLHREWTIKLIHCRRETNMIAGALGKRALALPT